MNKKEWSGVEIDSCVTGLTREVFFLIRYYIDLIETLNPAPTPGLLILYDYRSGTLDPLAQTLSGIKKDITESAEFKAKIVKFAHSCICFNIKTYVELLSNAILMDLANNKNKDTFLSPTIITAMLGVIKRQRVPNGYQRKTALNELAQICALHANSQGPGMPSADIFSAFITGVRNLDMTVYNFKAEYLPLLKIIYNVACSFYQINPEELMVMRRIPSLQTALRLYDTTLAAAPPTPAVMMSCSDRATPTSTTGVLYLDSINSVISDLPHVKFDTDLLASLR